MLVTIITLYRTSLADIMKAQNRSRICRVTNSRVRQCPPHTKFACCILCCEASPRVANTVLAHKRESHMCAVHHCALIYLHNLEIPSDHRWTVVLIFGNPKRRHDLVAVWPGAQQEWALHVVLEGDTTPTFPVRHGCRYLANEICGWVFW